MANSLQVSWDNCRILQICPEVHCWGIHTHYLQLYLWCQIAIGGDFTKFRSHPELAGGGTARFPCIIYCQTLIFANLAVVKWHLIVVLCLPAALRGRVCFCMVIVHSFCLFDGIESVLPIILLSCLFLLIYSLLHILKSNSLSISYVQIFLPHFGFSLHPSMVSFDTLKLSSLVQTIFFSSLYVLLCVCVCFLK